MMTFHTTPEFQTTSVDEVLAALDDLNPDNAIAVEVSRLRDGYMKNFIEHVLNLREIPDSEALSETRIIARSMISRSPRLSPGKCPIELISMGLVGDEIQRDLDDILEGA